MLLLLLLLPSVFNYISMCLIYSFDLRLNFAYNSIYWTLSNILNLSLEQNNKKVLVSLLLKSLRNTLVFFSPLNSLLSNLKLESSKS